MWKSSIFNKLGNGFAILLQLLFMQNNIIDDIIIYFYTFRREFTSKLLLLALIENGFKPLRDLPIFLQRQVVRLTAVHNTCSIVLFYIYV